MSQRDRQFGNQQACGVIFLSALVAGGCQPDPNDIHFIVSSGYRGPIAVVASPDFPEPVDFGNRADGFVLVVPETGVVCIPSYTIFHPYLHTAEYSDGSTIYRHGSLAPDSNAMRLQGFGAWGGPTNDRGVVWFGVGTEDEVDALERAFFNASIQELMPSGVSMRLGEAFENYERYCQ